MNLARRLPALVLLIGAFLPASVPAQNPTATFATGTQADEAAIRAVIDAEEDTGESPRIAANLDWENAFGIRYYDLKKRNDFYNQIVKPLQTNATGGTLEVKVKFLRPDLAVADEYWHVVGQIDQTTNKPGADRWGRTTFIFEKTNGAWIMVLSRVADLRDPYYKHYDTIPAAVPVPAATLAACAGSYEATPGKPLADITVNGDHLLVALNGQSLPAIPISPTEFLVFRPNDLASYLKIVFAPDYSAFDLQRTSGETLTHASKKH